MPAIGSKKYEVRGERIGEGSYGIVYKAYSSLTGREVALKRNVSEARTHGFFALREVDVLTRVKDHPFVVEFIEVISNSDVTFRDKLGDGFSSSDVNDRFHVALGLEQTNMERAMRKVPLPCRVLKIVFAQILLGLEWLHNRGIVHRDIKPGNILFNRSGKNPVSRICDFGLCGIVSGQPLNSPGLVTSWYRPPEICLDNPCNHKIDIWSSGMVALEMLTSSALLVGTKDNNAELLAKMFNKLPALAGSLGDVTTFVGNPFSSRMAAKVQKLIKPFTASIIASRGKEPMSKEEKHKALVEDIQAIGNENITRIRDFNASGVSGGGTYDQFCDLVARMLTFDPADRINATEALAHPFFDWLRGYIDSTRTSFPPSTPPLPSIKLYNTNERKCAYALIVRLFNNSTNIPWYDNLILIHGLDLFDRYVEYRVTNEGYESANSEITNSKLIWMKIYTCLYVFHKYMSMLEAPSEWEMFAPEGFNEKNVVRESVRFETFLIRDVCNFSIYRDTLAEIYISMNGRLSGRHARECIERLGSIPEGGWTGGSIRAFHRSFEEQQQQQTTTIEKQKGEE
jgi:serine/threonine protein kinase